LTRKTKLKNIKMSAPTIGTVNEEGQNVDLYIPRKCHASPASFQHSTMAQSNLPSAMSTRQAHTLAHLASFAFLASCAVKARAITQSTTCASATASSAHAQLVNQNG
jgi:hypothetical protein